jgi:hypothetical protein
MVVRDLLDRDGNISDSYGIGSGYHLLPHFNSNTNTNSDIFNTNTKRVSQIQIVTQVNLKCTGILFR